MVETYRSPKAGDPTVPIRMYVVTGGVYRQSFQFRTIDDLDVEIAKVNFTGWVTNGFYLNIADTPEKDAVTLVTTTSIEKQDALQGILLVKMTPEQTDVLKTNGVRVGHAWLWGIDENGDTQPLFRATVYVSWGIDDVVVGA